MLVDLPLDQIPLQTKLALCFCDDSSDVAQDEAGLSCDIVKIREIREIPNVYALRVVQETPLLSLRSGPGRMVYKAFIAKTRECLHYRARERSGRTLPGTIPKSRHIEDKDV